MTKTTKAARSLADLEGDIRQLRLKARRLEEKMDQSLNHFQQHSGSMFVRSLLPRKMEGDTGTLTGIRLLDTFLQNERLQRLLTRLADRVADRLGDGLNWLVDRVFRK